MRNIQFREFLKDETGQAMTEYILIIGLIAIPIFIAFKAAIVFFLNIFISNVVGSFSRG